MKKLLLLASAGAIALAAGSANAADLGVRPAYKAPPAVAAPLPWSWTGFYIGAHVGGGWGTKEAFDPFSGKTEGTGTVNGFLGGFQAGYNYQISWVVVGIDGDFSFSDVKGANIFGGPFCCDENGRVDARWFSTFTGRIGGTVDHALLYVKGGVAWVNDRYFSGPTCCGDFAAFSTDDTRTGWTVGAGVEFAFTPSWSGKLEYDFMDFGTHRIHFTCAGDCESAFDLDFRQRVHAVKVGLNYRFDWGKGKAPVVARY